MSDASPEVWIVTRPGGRLAYYLPASYSSSEEVARQHLTDFAAGGSWPHRWPEGDTDAGECWYSHCMAAGEVAVWITKGTIDV